MACWGFAAETVSCDGQLLTLAFYARKTAPINGLNGAELRAKHEDVVAGIRGCNFERKKAMCLLVRGFSRVLEGDVAVVREAVEYLLCSGFLTSVPTKVQKWGQHFNHSRTK